MRESMKTKLPRHMSALSVHKEFLERRITQEMKKRIPCALTLQRLKRLRLATKDRMEEVRRRMNSATAFAST